jgi:polyisoprenoid-binding protein YceI
MVARAFFLLLMLPLMAGAQNLEPLRFVVDSERSWIHILVYRAGLMSMLGHNHVMSTGNLSGTLSCNEHLTTANMELYFPAASLEVDAAELRDLEGEDFPGHISERDITGTRKNMLGQKLLDAASNPTISIVTTAVAGEPDSLVVTADVTVAGLTNSIQFDASAAFDAGDIKITGNALISHKSLGLKPFSAAFGTLKVRREIVVRFEIVAVPAARQE